MFYQKTRQRVRVPVDAALIAEAEEAVARAWELAEYGEIPPPLVDSPKCVGCSLNTICLPDETNQLTSVDLSGAAQLGLFEVPADDGAQAAGQRGNSDADPATDDAKRRSEAAVSEHAGIESGEIGRGAPGQGEG